MPRSRERAIDEQLTQLRDASPVTFRDIEQALVAIRPHGEEAVLAWVTACWRDSTAFRSRSGFARA